MAEAVVDQPRTADSGAQPLREVPPLWNRAEALVEKEQAGTGGRAVDQVVMEEMVGLQLKQRHGCAPGGRGRGYPEGDPPVDRGENCRKIPLAAAKGNGRSIKKTGPLAGPCFFHSLTGAWLFSGFFPPPGYPGQTSEAGAEQQHGGWFGNWRTRVVCR